MSSLNSVLTKLDPSMVNNPQSLHVTRTNLERIVVGHSVAAAVAGLAGGFLPGIASVIAVLTSTGSIWLMYYNICRELGLDIPQNILRALGSAMLSNLATQLAGVFLLEVALCFVPGMAIVVGGAACYGVTYLAGYLFIKLLVDVFGGGRDPQKMSEATLKNAAAAACQAVDCEAIYKDAYGEAKEKIRKGEINRNSGC